MIASLAAAALLAGIPMQMGGMAGQMSASNSGTTSGGKAGQSSPQIGRRASRFIGGGSDYYGIAGWTYPKHQRRTVAQDKRDSRKARNRLRMKGRR